MAAKPHSAITLVPMTEQERARRSAVDRRCAELIRQGICPTCQQFATGDVFPGQMEQTYYQDERITCHLETYPRGIGHTIILSRAHYADIADMPVDLGCHIMRVTHALVNALKDVVGADKVYMHTMCSGALSHLHFQLIPRRPGEQIGGRVFASERGILTNYEDTLAALREALQELLR
jgi:histidine triad (HIT) family protein